MMLSRAEFENKLNSNALKIAFIGMSNSGKSHFSKYLVEKESFERCDIDGEVGARLDVGDVHDLAKWMGMPYDSQFPSHQALYLEQEEIITLEGLNRESYRNLIVDTTGSICHLSDLVQKKLTEDFLVIYLQLPPEKISDMIDFYFEHPKPVIFGSHFSIQRGEDNVSAVRSSYPKLLAARQKVYESLSDVIIPAFDPNGVYTSSEDFWSYLLDSLYSN